MDRCYHKWTNLRTIFFSFFFSNRNIIQRTYGKIHVGAKGLTMHGDHDASTWFMISCSHGGKYLDISAIYRRYIVYQEGSTWYFMEKNRRGDISVNIAKISAIYQFGEIYRRFFQKIASGGKKAVIYRRYIADFLVIFPLLHATWSDGPDHARVDPTA